MSGFSKINLLDLDAAEVKAHIARLGYPAYVADQILEWVYKKYVFDFAQMTNLSKAARAQLSEAFDVRVYEPTERLNSSDHFACKYVFTVDGGAIESVVIREPRFHSLCVSSQMGCAMKCGFCLTGVAGFKRNLSPGEIVAQFLRAQKDGEHISRIVFMGMGEPLANFDRVMKAIRILTDPLQGGLGKRRITVSTSGLLAGIQRLIDEDIHLNLAFSVGFADPVRRHEVMPLDVKNPLADVVAALKTYLFKHNRKLTLEYTLLEGLNDTPSALDHLARLAKKLDAKVNLINLNPHREIPYRPVSTEVLTGFKAALQEKGLRVTIRFTKGQDIVAACGQLGESILKELASKD